jgi:hypothetical protein
MRIIRLTESPQLVAPPCILLSHIPYVAATSSLYSFDGRHIISMKLIEPNSPLIFINRYSEWFVSLRSTGEESHKLLHFDFDVGQFLCK